jgi:malonyl-CoA O-methyltransferase
MDWRDKRKVMLSYNVTADSYDEQYTDEQRRKYRKALEKVDVTNNAVLDVGCGSGLFFKEVEAQAEMIVGVDVSHNLLLKAKERAKASQNTFVLQADADHLPFSNSLFGAVFAFTVFQNMPKPTETLRELKRVAKKSGSVVVTGLKKAFSLDKFMDIVNASGMETVVFVDEEAVNCYVAVLAV